VVTLERAPIYAVLFDGTVDPDSDAYSPLVTAQYGAGAPVTVPHGLDKEVVAALPGLWYCLHLPNTMFEVIELPPSFLATAQSWDLGHHILLAPIAAFTPAYVGALLAQGIPVLAVCSDELLAEASERCLSLGFALQPVPYSQLSSESLEEHWRSIYELTKTDKPYLGRVPRLSRRLAVAPADLPRRWLARQLDGTEDARAETHEPVQDAAIYHALDAQTLLQVAVRLEDDDDEAVPVETMLAEVRAGFRVPVTLAAPGVAPAYVKTAYDADLRAASAGNRSTITADTWTTATDAWSDASAELSAIRFLVTHRAIARGGVGIGLPPVPAEAFGLLAQLEAHLRTPEPKGKTVTTLLDRLANATANFWTPAVVAAVARASTLTVFSKLPARAGSPAGRHRAARGTRADYLPTAAPTDARRPGGVELRAAHRPVGKGAGSFYRVHPPRRPCRQAVAPGLGRSAGDARKRCRQQTHRA